MSNKIRVCVVMGGPSAEHDVSLRTGQAMIDNLDKQKYEICVVQISRLGLWNIDGDEIGFGEAIKWLEANADVVLLAVHGTFGEDGTLQAALELHDIPFTGSSAVASLLAIDKIVSGELFQASGLTIPKTIMLDIDNAQSALDKIKAMLPVVIKPVRQGSSVGVSLVKDAESIQAACDLAMEHDHEIMVQEYIDGREVSCGVMHDPAKNELIALPPTEIIIKNGEFFDYNEKYSADGAEEITPADMPEELIAEIQAVARRAHEILGCSGYSRTDIIVRGKELVVIEINTLPGMTETSILPRQAAAAGMGFDQVLDMLIDNALAKKLSNS